MPPVSQKITPNKGTDFDTDELYIEDMKAVFLKNITAVSTANPGASIKEGQNEFVFTPLESNSRYCTMELPAGTNYCVGFKYFKEINRGFVCVWNSGNQHLVYQIDARTGICQQLLTRECFNFQLNPAHFMAEARMAVQTTCRFNKVTDQQETVIFLCLTDDFNPQRMLCVDDIIATSGFNKTLYPYFNTTGDCEDCNYINLGITPNMSCIQVAPVERNLDDPAELLKQNRMTFKAWEFRVMGIDVWGRQTDHGPISTKYINSIGGTCVQSSSGLPRCVNLTFDAGCPIIDKWQIEFRNCSGNISGFSVESDWFLSDSIEKYDNCKEQNWWQRERNTTDNSFTYDALTNTITYTFCADKECQPLPIKETNKTSNFLPITSGSVFALGNNVALARNTRGFEPLDCKQLEKMEFTVEPPAPVANCTAQKLRKVKIWGIIWNPYAKAPVSIRRKSEKVVFGYADCGLNNYFAFDQVLPTGQEGIIGYMAGTNQYSISRQYSYKVADGEKIYVGTEYLPVAQVFRPLQLWEFDLLPGQYIFRIAAHQSTPADDYQRTSTYTVGQTSLTNPGIPATQTKEILINVCEDDVEILDNPMVIMDLTYKGRTFGCLSGAASVNAGYLYEDQVNQIPIEQAEVSVHFGTGIFPLILVFINRAAYGSYFTDHNGFYFATTRRFRLQTTLYGRKDCADHVELAKSRKSLDAGREWYRFDKLYAYKDTVKYLTKDRAIIKGKISLCESPAIGIAGALVVMTNGGFATTNEKGEFQIVAHDGPNATRTEQLYYSQKGTCYLLDCSTGCISCFPTPDVLIPACTGIDRVINMPLLQVRINGYNLKGPQMGGRYEVGIVEHDWLDRLTFVQTSDKHYLNIPSLQTTGVYDFSKIFFDLTGMVFSPGTKKVSFWITDNLNEQDYLTWVAERVQLVDNTGISNTASPTKIRLYYEGLNEYNKQNDFSTNAVWDFISNREDGSVVLGDQVEFLANGDGTIYSKKIVALISYDKIGKYIQVPYTEDLKDLKDGALIKLIRQRECLQTEFFYELCPIIDVVNGVPQILTGQLEFFDAYLLNRQIPVPVTVITKTPATETVKEIETSTTENKLHNYPFLFEHHSPSDFWGDHCRTRGRVNVKNLFENQQCRTDEIIMSRALTNDGRQNGLHRYSEDDAIYIGQQYSGITACIAELSVVMVICEHATLLLPFNDTNVKVAADGKVYAPTLDDKFGKPQKKIGSDFGCQPWDINTIRVKNGIVMFVDSASSAVVKNNFSDSIDVTMLGARGIMTSNIKDTIRNNAGANKKYFHAVIDPKTSQYLLTLSILAGVAGDYINQVDDLVVGANETLVFNMLADKWEGSRSYTPEYYGWMDGDINDMQMLAFQFGQAWKQHELNSPTRSYCNFFGVQCHATMEFVFNRDSTKVKKFLFLETYCKEVLLYADKITTESGQLSRIMPLWWEKRDKFWSADFKCDTLTIADVNMPVGTGANALLDGDSLYGRWLRARIRPKVADSDKYFEFTSAICFFNGQEKSGG